MNADIVKGPVNQTVTIPVNPQKFLAICQKYKNAVLSIGWTTLWGSNYRNDAYTEQEIADMVKVIKENNITNRDITFPVRAGIAANSLPLMKDLVRQIISLDNMCTFTIWSSPNDYVDIVKLREFIYEIGIERVYLDVPKEISDELKL